MNFFSYGVHELDLLDMPVIELLHISSRSDRLLRFWTQLELDLNSVERVVEYLGLPQEPPAVIESSRPPAYWPSSSNEENMLVVENLIVKYSPELPAVLHGISFTLRGRERVGLLGRTGSGKSTLAMSLLRFVSRITLWPNKIYHRT